MGSQTIHKMDGAEPAAQVDAAKPLMTRKALNAWCDALDEQVRERDRVRYEEDTKLLAEVQEQLAALDARITELKTLQARLMKGLGMTESNAPEEEGPSARMRILVFLSEHKRASTVEIADSIRTIPQLTIRQALYDMSSKSKTVERVGPSLWQLSPRGRLIIKGAPMK
jgi:hypothetical protein